jgi:protein TonB
VTGPDRTQDARPHLVERIVDIVFAGEPAGRGRRSGISFAAVLFAMCAVGVLMGRQGPSAGPWSAEMAARVHDAIAAERSVELTPPSAAPLVTPQSTLPLPAAHAPRQALKGLKPSSHVRPASTAPARAVALAAALDAPVDFTGTAFVVGNSASHAGGTTMRSGTGQTPVTGAVAVGSDDVEQPTSRSLARSVSLDQSAWSCQWPSEADAQQIDEQTVVLRVTVRPDGRAERADIVSDPGFGFGQAARVCALATRFEPARDSAGLRIGATSPPIRVHFSR